MSDFLSSSFRVLSVLRFYPYMWVSTSHPSSFHPSRCRLVFSPGSSPSGITFFHRFRLPLAAPALSLSLPLFFWWYSLYLLSTPSVFVSFLLFYMTYCSFSAWHIAPLLLALFRLCSRVLRYPGFPLSIYDSAFFLGFTSSSFLLDSPVSFFHASVVLSCDFFSTINFSFGFSLRNFRRLPSLGTVSSVPMSCSFSGCVDLVGLLCLSTLFLYCPWFPFLSFLPVRHFPFILWALFWLGCISISLRDGVSLWAESVLVWPLCIPRSLVFAHLSTFLYVCLLLLLSRSFSSLWSFIDTSYRLGGFPSILRLAFTVHTVSLFATSLAGLPFVPSCSFLLSSFLQFLMGLLSFWWTFSSFLLGHGLAFMGNFSTYRVRFRFGSSLFVFSTCWVSLPCVLRMLLFLTSLRYVTAFFCFPSFVNRSNLSSFATGSSLRAEFPLSVVSCLLSHSLASCPLFLVSFLFCSVFSHSFSSLCRFPSASSCFLRVFSTSLRCRLAFPSALVLFLFLVSAALSSWRFFPSSFLLHLSFFLVLSPYSCC